MSEKSQDQLWDEWKTLVNMTASELSDWLDTEESRSVGDTDQGEESTGHKSGRRIVDILKTAKGDFSDSDWDHVAEVVGYIKRHGAQGGPADNLEESRWYYSLKNWGHDALGEKGVATENSPLD
jgi:hypothetical protein